jgi:hypothetical protein
VPLLSGTKQSRSRLCATAVRRDQGRRHFLGRSLDDRSWLWIPERYQEGIFGVPQAVLTAGLERYNGDWTVGGQGEILVGRHGAENLNA